MSHFQMPTESNVEHIHFMRTSLTNWDSLFLNISSQILTSRSPNQSKIFVGPQMDRPHFAFFYKRFGYFETHIHFFLYLFFFSWFIKIWNTKIFLLRSRSLVVNLLLHHANPFRPKALASILLAQQQQHSLYVFKAWWIFCYEKVKI